MWNKLLSRSFDAWSSTYDNDIAKSFSRRGITYERIWSEIESELGVSNPSYLLEIGVGTGAVGRCSDGHSIVGLDISKGMLTEAKKTNHYHQLVHTSADRLPFLDHVFDGIYTAFMFHSERQPVRLLRECKRVLKPGGRLVIVDLFPRGREQKSRHFLWSNLHSLRYEKLAPSLYRPIEQQAERLKQYFSDVNFKYIDVSHDVHGKAVGQMSHGIISGQNNDL